jgi:PAS domain S-box-containing protein
MSNSLLFEKMNQFSLEFAPGAIYWIDQNGHFLYVNNTACEMLEYTKEELMQLNVVDVDGKFDMQGFKEKWNQLSENDHVVFESQHKTKSGNLIPVEINIRLLVFENLHFQFAFAQDITDRKRNELERYRLEQKMIEVQKWEAIGALVSGIAHDFGNILTGILGYTNLLQRDSSNPIFLTESLESIEKLSDRATRLIRQLLGFARKGKIQSMAVDLHQILKEVKKMIDNTSDKRILSILYLNAENPFVFGDPTQLFQVFLNLAINARDALPNGGKIQFKTRNLSSIQDNENKISSIIIDVEDNGIGIPDEIKSKIYDPFFTTKSDIGGTGLGLAMVQSIVQSHQGYISFDSKLGEGTCFHIRLPSYEENQSKDLCRPDFKCQKIGTIWIVDDEEPIQKIMAKIGEYLGCSVRVFHNGEELLTYSRMIKESIDQFKDQYPKLLFLDLNMPHISGEDCYYTFKKLFPRVPVVIMTGLENEIRTQMLLADGAVEYLQKPFGINEVKEILIKVGSKSQLI